MVVGDLGLVIRTFLHQWRLLLANEGGLNEITTRTHPWHCDGGRLLSIFGTNIGSIEGSVDMFVCGKKKYEEKG